VGKRSGSGVVAHKATLVNALSRALSERVTLLDFTIGRRGLLGYLKALAGSNIIKIVPAVGSASEVRTSDKRLKVTCGSHTSYLEDLAWVGEKTPLTLCEVRISPNRTVKPNMGGLELSEALNRVLLFTAKEDNRPVLQCVLFKAGEGKLTMVSADGFRLAVVTLDYDGEGEALILRDDLRGIANALRKAHRVALSFENMPADIEGGEVRVRIDGAYLTEALRACGGMVDFKITDGKSPVLFAVDGYQLVVMPMLTSESQKPEPQAEHTEPTAEPAETTEPEPEAEAEKTEAVAEAEAVVKAEKPKRSRKKEPVAVA